VEAARVGQLQVGRLLVRKLIQEAAQHLTGAGAVVERQRRRSRP
jgi:hypothetical protein